jgi:hypothetical protein
MKKEIDWSKELANARKQLHRNKTAIEATPLGTPADWSRPDYDKPIISPDPTAPPTQFKRERYRKKERKQFNKTFIPQQRQKAKRSDSNGGLPVVKKVQP